MTNHFKTREQLAQDLGISAKTLRRMLKRRGLNPPKGLLSPDWVVKIKDALGIAETDNPDKSE